MLKAINGNGQGDEVVVVDDHITDAVSEHQAGKLLVVYWRSRISEMTGSALRRPLATRSLLLPKVVLHQMGSMSGNVGAIANALSSPSRKQSFRLAALCDAQFVRRK